MHVLLSRTRQGAVLFAYLYISWNKISNIIDKMKGNEERSSNKNTSAMYPRPCKTSLYRLALSTKMSQLVHSI
jgi:hypothetical protein